MSGLCRGRPQPRGHTDLESDRCLPAHPDRGNLARLPPFGTPYPGTPCSLVYRLRTWVSLINRNFNNIQRVPHLIYERGSCCGSAYVTATSKENTRQSILVAAASGQTTQNVQTVASAAEEFSASIREISHQITFESGMIQECVHRAMLSNDQALGRVDGMPDMQFLGIPARAVV